MSLEIPFSKVIFFLNIIEKKPMAKKQIEEEKVKKMKEYLSVFKQK